jgi:hypothetical protein
MQVPQEASQFRVQLSSNSRHRGMGETTELITGFVDREESLPIRMAPYRNVKWCVHHDGGFVPEHPFHDDVVSHEVRNG